MVSGVPKKGITPRFVLIIAQLCLRLELWLMMADGTCIVSMLQYY